MKRIFLFAVLILSSTWMISCGGGGGTTDAVASGSADALSDSDFAPVEIKGDYKVLIPNSMTESTALNAEAALQYANVFKEMYVILIDEPKEEFVKVYKELGLYDESKSPLQNYRDVQLQFLAEGIQMTSQPSPSSVEINGVPAELAEFDGIATGISQEIAYFLSFYESPENVYMMMAWTLKDKKADHRPVYQKITQSFQLL